MIQSNGDLKKKTLDQIDKTKKTFKDIVMKNILNIWIENLYKDLSLIKSNKDNSDNLQKDTGYKRNIRGSLKDLR